MNIKLLHPVSRGSLKLNSVDPRVPPVIDPAYLSNPEDIRVLIRGICTVLINMNIQKEMLIIKWQYCKHTLRTNSLMQQDLTFELF